MPSLIPWLTVDDNLISSDDNISQHRASVRRCICRAVARTVGVMRAIIDDEMLTVSIELCQNPVCSIPGVGTICILCV